MGVHPVAHTAVSPHGRGWCVGVQQFAHTPLSTHAQGLVCGRLPSRPHARLLYHTQAASCHAFCSVHGNCPSVIASRWQLSFTELPYVFVWYMATALTCMYMATALTCTSADDNSSFLHGNCPSMLVSTWQLSLLPEHVFLPCLF